MQINPKELHDLVDTMYSYIDHIPNYSPGKSIVTSIYNGEFATGFVLLKELARLNVRLPVEVFYREGELSQNQIDILCECEINLKIKKIKGNAKDFTTIYGGIAGWSTKIYALLESKYEENLWIDADNFPIVNPDFLFDDPDYIEKGSLFWRDLMSPDRSNRYHDNAVIWPIFNVVSNDAEPFETGQLLINKPRCWSQMRLVKHYADNCEIYYHFGGDSETFRMAWQHWHLRNGGIFPRINYHTNLSISSPYGFIPYGPFHKGIYNEFGKWGGGTVMVQRDRQGNELFNHRNLNKMKLGKNVINNDVTNEGFYHSHINELKLLMKDKV
jgi:alpha 1,2-mannosyltransferase